MKLKSLLFSSLLLLSAGTAWADVTINSIHFFDANFRSWLKNQSYGRDGVLTDAEIAEVTEMYVGSKSIKYLSGIEYFTALEWLSCSNNQLIELDVSKNTKLTVLQCSGNKLTSLDLSKNTALTRLECGANRLTSLDVSKNTALTYLYCENNQLTSLDVSKNTKLYSLSCYGNQLTSLDMSKNTKLAGLHCYQNRIKGAAMDALVASLRASIANTMRVIYYENEQNVMTTTQVDAAKAKGWTPYYTEDGNTWKEYAGVDPFLEINETNFPDWNFRNYLLSQSYGKDEMLTDEEIAGVTSISVASKRIQSLKGIEYFTALTTLYCHWNQLTSLDVSKNTKLTSLDCYSNQLTSLDVSKNTKLGRLSCDANQLTSLDVSGCTALTQLICSGNPLTSLDLSKNTKLISLYCGATRLTALDVSKNTALRDLRCYVNQLTSLDVTKNTKLERLYCSNNKLTSLDLSKNTKLTDLYCYQNQIKGAAMDALVASLPTVSRGEMRVVHYENEQNVMTTTQVAAAKAKGWIPYYTDGSLNSLGDPIWKEYASVDPSTGVNNVEASDSDDSAPWYTINGTLLSGKPTEKGIYIHNGKKVIVK